MLTNCQKFKLYYFCPNGTTLKVLYPKIKDNGDVYWFFKLLPLVAILPDGYELWEGQTSAGFVKIRITKDEEEGALFSISFYGDNQDNPYPKTFHFPLRAYIDRELPDLLQEAITLYKEVEDLNTDWHSLLEEDEED
jgi:hypothetical protein